METKPLCITQQPTGAEGLRQTEEECLSYSLKAENRTFNVCR